MSIALVGQADGSHVLVAAYAHMPIITVCSADPVGHHATSLLTSEEARALAAELIVAAELADGRVVPL